MRRQHLAAVLPNVAAAFFSLYGLTAMAQTAPTPLVRIFLEINSAIVTNNLTGTDVARVKQELAAYAAAKLPSPGFEFVRWMPNSDAQSSDPTAEFHIVIREDNSGGMPRLMLDYRATVRGQIVPLPTIASQPIYDGPAPSVHSASRLIADIESRRFDKDLINEDFRKRLGEGFVRNIPLSEKLVVSAGNADIIVPLDFDGLHASDQSHLLVRFTAKPDEKPADTGLMRLRPIKRVVDGDFLGSVYCRVYMFEFREVRVPEPGSDDPRVVGILLPSSVKSAQIFMERFERMTGDLFTSPNP